MKKNVLDIQAIHEVTSYPYGRLRTSAFFSIEFVEKKGFRAVFQTINPKNGRHNAPKKNTYCTFDCNVVEEGTGHIKTFGYNVHGYEGINKMCAFIADHFEALNLTDAMIKYLFCHCAATIKAAMLYTRIPTDLLFPVMEDVVKTCIKGMATGENLFNQVIVPIDEINKLKAQLEAQPPIVETLEMSDIFKN